MHLLFHRINVLDRASRAFCLLSLCLSLAIIALSFSPTPSLYAEPLAQSTTSPTSSPLVLAFYYPWFDENTWRSGQVSDFPTTLYTSRDRAIMGQQIAQARRAGIDAFLVAWYGPGDNNQTEPNLKLLLDEAAIQNFKIGILFETDSSFLGNLEHTTQALQYLLRTHTSHSAYLRIDNRPVLFFWHPSHYEVGDWQNVRSQVDPANSSVWINEGVDTSYLSVFDGHYLYSNTWNPPADLTDTNQKFAKQVANASTRYSVHKYWVATVMPGYNDRLARPQQGFVQDRQGGAYYQRSWAAAIASQADWVVITSFNEWLEGTYIEPSVTYGEQYLDLTASGSQQFKTGRGVMAASPAPSVPVQPMPVSMASLPIATPTSLPLPTATVPTAYVRNSAGINLRTGPGTSYNILTVLQSGTAMPIVGYDPAHVDWWQVQAAAGVGWLYAPLLQMAGPMEKVPQINFLSTNLSPGLSPDFILLPTPTPTPAAKPVLR